MQSVSSFYQRLLSDPEHVRETKTIIAGMEYEQDRLISCSVDGGIIPDLTVGRCFSQELDVVIEPLSEVPRMAQIALFSRLRLGDETSEWVPAGVFFVDTRAGDEADGTLTLHGFDGMLKAEQTYAAEGETGTWPRSQQAVAADIAAKMGVRLDPRTKILPGWEVEHPNDLTMREVLEEIAAAQGGNWSMNGAGELLFTPLNGLPAETNLLVDSEDGGAILFGEVRIIV